MNIMKRAQIIAEKAESDKRDREIAYYKEIKGKAFAKNLKSLLQINDKYQQDIVEDLKVSKSTVSTWCNGKKVPRMDTILRLAAYFNVPVSELLNPDESSGIGGATINPLSLQVALFVERDDSKDVELLRAYNMLDSSDREMVRDFAVRLATKKE